MMKPIRFLSVLMIVLVLCCGCQRTVNPEQKGNITLYQMADDGSKPVSYTHLTLPTNSRV